jgi:hypothetical protein
VTLNFLELTFLGEDLPIPQYVAPAVIFALVVLAILMVFVCGPLKAVGLGPPSGHEPGGCR